MTPQFPNPLRRRKDRELLDHPRVAQALAARRPPWPHWPYVHTALTWYAFGALTALAIRYAAAWMGG